MRLTGTSGIMHYKVIRWPMFVNFIRNWEPYLMKLEVSALVFPFLFHSLFCHDCHLLFSRENKYPTLVAIFQVNHYNILGHHQWQQEEQVTYAFEETRVISSQNYFCFALSNF